MAEPSRPSSPVEPEDIRTTPGTRVHWVGLSGWLNAWDDLHRRATGSPSTRRYQNRREHAITDLSEEISSETDVGLLEKIQSKLRREVKREYGGPQNQAVRGAIAANEILINNRIVDLERTTPKLTHEERHAQWLERQAKEGPREIEQSNLLPAKPDPTDSPREAVKWWEAMQKVKRIDQHGLVQDAGDVEGSLGWDAGRIQVAVIDEMDQAGLTDQQKAKVLESSKEDLASTSISFYDKLHGLRKLVESWDAWRKVSRLTVPVREIERPEVIPLVETPETDLEDHPEDDDKILELRRKLRKVWKTYERAADRRMEARKLGRVHPQTDEAPARWRRQASWLVDHLNKRIYLRNAEPGWERMPPTAGKVEMEGDNWRKLGEWTTRRQAMRHATQVVGKEAGIPTVALDRHGRWWAGDLDALDHKSVDGLPLRLIGKKYKKWEAAVDILRKDPDEDEINARKFFDTVKTIFGEHYPGGRLKDADMETYPPIDPAERLEWEHRVTAHKAKVTEEERQLEEERQKRHEELERRQAAAKAEQEKRDAAARAEREVEEKRRQDEGATAKEFWGQLQEGDWLQIPGTDLRGNPTKLVVYQVVSVKELDPEMGFVGNRTVELRRKGARKTSHYRLNQFGAAKHDMSGHRGIPNYGWVADTARPAPYVKPEKRLIVPIEWGPGMHEFFADAKKQLDTAERTYADRGIKGPKADNVWRNLRDVVVMISKLEPGEDIGSEYSGIRRQFQSAIWKINEYLREKSKARYMTRTKEQRAQATQEAIEDERPAIQEDKPAHEINKLEPSAAMKSHPEGMRIFDHLLNRRLIEKYTISDYPIGRGFRGQLKVSVEHDPRRGWRVVTQTTTRTGGWYKPKATTYSPQPSYVIHPEGDEQGVLLHFSDWGNTVRVTKVRGQEVMSASFGEENKPLYDELLAVARSRRVVADVGVSEAQKEEIAKRNEKRRQERIVQAKTSYLKWRRELQARTDQIAGVVDPERLGSQARRSHETAKRIVESEGPRRLASIRDFLKREGIPIPGEEQPAEVPPKSGTERIHELERQQRAKPAPRMSEHNRRMGQFMTPMHVAYGALDMIGIEGMSVFDPTAGEGRFMRFAKELGAREVHGVEIDAKMAEYSGAIHGNFLDLPAGEPLADVLAMNPPFTTRGIPGVTDTQAIVDKAINEHWTRRGKAILILPVGRIGEQVMEKYSHMVKHQQDLDADAFKKEGTMVRARLYILDPTLDGG